jgi:predicted alpha/beta-fold hydrolase
MVKKIFLPLLFLAVTLANHAGYCYDYPFSDPYVATILGTPAEYQPSLPEKVTTKLLHLTVFPERRPPKIFWYHKKLRCSLTYHNHPAPLIFIIAGTGGDHNGPLIKLLERVFYHAGFHVISLPSPTHPNFIVSASETGVPGHLADDCRDLYRVMERAWANAKRQIRTKEFYLTGISLGALEAAYIARLDEEQHLFGFKKVLLINPLVDIYMAARTLDKMFEDNIPGGLNNFNAFFDKMIQRFSAVYQAKGFIDFNEDFLYAVFNQPSTALEEMAAVIGLSYRIASSNMIFTSDVVSRYGLIVPKNRQLSRSDSTTNYFKVTFFTSFRDYFEQMFYPFFRERLDNITPEALLEISSLKHLEGYLKDARHIALMTNADDFLYRPGDIDYLRTVFKDRAYIYPRGGHCGNIGYKDNIARMLDFFKN